LRLYAKIKCYIFAKQALFLILIIIFALQNDWCFMKRLFLSLLLLTGSLCIHAQNDTIFRGYLYNEEYKVFIRMNFYENNVVSMQQELFGELPGYLAYDLDAREWLFTSAKIVGKRKAEIEITNDYGSEDLTATLTCNTNGDYVLKQGKGSRIKIAVNRKWVKLPMEMTFRKRTAPRR